MERGARSGRILLAEDAPANVLLFRTLLERAGHHVTVACDGESAVDHALAHPFDLVLMDLGLPRLDGRDAAQRIADAKPSLAIVALTAEDDPAVARACIAAGMRSVLTKPIPPKTFIDAVDAALGAAPDCDRNAASTRQAG